MLREICVEQSHGYQKIIKRQYPFDRGRRTKSLPYSPFLRYSRAMGLEVGGHTDVPDWPKLGPSLLIATCLILAIRTAKWPALTKRMLSDSELDQEVNFAEYMARKVLSHLMARNEAMFPQRKQPWYQPDGKDCPE